jgi:hypothetical protein
MATFTPPSQNVVPPVLPVGEPDQSGPAYRLFRYFRSRPEGITVWVYRAGSHMATELGGQVSETDPYTIYDSSGDPVSNGQDDVLYQFMGGAGPYDIDAATAALLTAAGYTVT